MEQQLAAPSVSIADTCLTSDPPSPNTDTQGQLATAWEEVLVEREARAVAQQEVEEGKAALACAEGEEAVVRKLSLPALERLVQRTKKALLMMETVLHEHRSDVLLCGICMDARKDTVLVPCGHQACRQCAAQLMDCHVCRVRIERHVRTFDAS